MLDAAHAGLTSEPCVWMAAGGDELAVDVRYVTLVAAADVSVLGEQGSRLKHTSICNITFTLLIRVSTSTIELCFHIQRISVLNLKS